MMSVAGRCSTMLMVAIATILSPAAHARIFTCEDESGRVIRWFGTHTDVTERLRAEAALRDADRRKDEFLAMLGHELRNPLSAIRNATTLLKEGATDAASALCISAG